MGTGEAPCLWLCCWCRAGAEDCIRAGAWSFDAGHAATSQFRAPLQPEVTQGPALNAVSSPVLCHTEVQELNEFLKLVLVSAGFCCLFVFNFPSRQGGGSLAGFSSRLMSHQFSHITEAIKLSNKLQWPLSSAACGGQRDSPAQAAPITFIATYLLLPRDRGHRRGLSIGAHHVYFKAVWCPSCRSLSAESFFGSPHTGAAPSHAAIGLGAAH